jgi:YfiH family protein
MAAKFLKPFKFGKSVLAFVSTKQAGNLGYHVGDDHKKVTVNRKRLAKALGFDIHSITCGKQTHNNKVMVVTPKLKGRGALDWNSAFNNTDALITKTPGICLMINVADCVPLLFYDPVKKVIGATHAGWRGTALKIAQKTVSSMVKLGSKAKDIKVGIGPSIGPCCYEVSRDVAMRFKSYICKGNKYFVDLKFENKDQLIKAGIQSKNIQSSKLCTKCNSDEFFSARVKTSIGRFGAGIMLN